MSTKNPVEVQRPGRLLLLVGAGLVLGCILALWLFTIVFKIMIPKTGCLVEPKLGMANSEYFSRRL